MFDLIKNFFESFSLSGFFVFVVGVSNGICRIISNVFDRPKYKFFQDCIMNIDWIFTCSLCYLIFI